MRVVNTSSRTTRYQVFGVILKVWIETRAETVIEDILK